MTKGRATCPTEQFADYSSQMPGYSIFAASRFLYAVGKTL